MADSSGYPERLRKVYEALQEERFPMGTHDINYSVGDLEVEGRKGDLVAVRDLTDRFPARSFDSPEEVIEEIRKAA